ncbi:hypothetical protein JST56_07755 [Candidatus Dependentiae bacterium]|nr:hypothetical protein [Candidatus Dependentiae bacterium]
MPEIKNIVPAQHLMEFEQPNFDFLLGKNSEEEIIKELQLVSPGISTGYKIGAIDLSFPGGAVSIIAAPTGHGKTTALINFTLGALERNPDQDAYFFTYEESGASILSLFVNSWVNKNLSNKSIGALSKNNRKSIENYFRSGTDEFFTDTLRSLFKMHKDQFFQDLINTERLKVFYSDWTANQLIEAIHFIKNNRPRTGLIVIDYMQLLKLSNSKISRQEELKKICLMLKDCAIKTGLPIVLAAQFNRTVVTESELRSENIGEAGDIERIASLILGMFNLDTDTTYFKVLKGRSIGKDHQEFMSFNGNACILKNRPKASKNYSNSERISFND